DRGPERDPNRPTEEARRAHHVAYAAPTQYGASRSRSSPALRAGRKLDGSGFVRGATAFLRSDVVRAGAAMGGESGGEPPVGSGAGGTALRGGRVFDAPAVVASSAGSGPPRVVASSAGAEPLQLDSSPARSAPLRIDASPARSAPPRIDAEIGRAHV